MTFESNKELYLKKCIFTALLLFVQSMVFAQINVYGNWSINRILGLGDFQEYSIVRQDDKNPWGNMLTLNLDGTFLCGNTSPCGNDVFRNFSGNFIKIDDSHIRFIVKTISSSSYNKTGDSESNLNKDLGVFYIYKKGETIRLILSNEILEDDKRSSLND